MQINIKKAIAIPSELEKDIEEKFSALAKFIKHFDASGEAEMWIEVSRTTKHHKKGEVFKVSADLRLPHKVLRAEEYAENMRTAIDEARNVLRAEIDKYKTRFVELDKKKLAK